MVGGELEGIDMVIHTTNGDKRLPDNLLEIHPNDEVSWIFRSIYIPTTTSNHRTLWYISDSSNTAEYNLGTVTATLPVPASYNSPANRALYFFDAKEEEKHFGNLVVYYYYLDEDTKKGISDLWTNYGNVGLDCKLVVLNLDSGIYNTIDIKNYSENTIVVKGVAELRSLEKVAIPATVTSHKAVNRSQNVTLNTGYSGDVIQSFPITDKGDGLRTFYMPVDSRLVLTIESTFDIESVSVEGDMYANDSFTGASYYINDNKRSVSIVFTTIYYEENDEKDKDMRGACVNDNSVFKLKINSIPFYVKVIVYV